ncbi:hypothetical protein LY78DRAFT_86794 [Colletotrichum sublineola]|nr:hypothetical protein LY78DRAFT_86794 [Colletotrichum sublineola]
MGWQMGYLDTIETSDGMMIRNVMEPRSPPPPLQGGRPRNGSSFLVCVSEQMTSALFIAFSLFFRRDALESKRIGEGGEGASLYASRVNSRRLSHPGVPAKLVMTIFPSAGGGAVWFVAESPS